MHFVSIFLFVREMVKIMFMIMDCFVYCLRNKACLSREGEYEVMHELEELSMQIVRADPEDSNHYPLLGRRSR